MQRLLLLIGLLVSVTTWAQVGKEFPMLIGQLVDGKRIDLPESTLGKYTLVGMSWSRKAEEDFEGWVNPVWNKFVLKSGMMDKFYNINVYFIPMFVGTKKGAMENVMKRMEAKSDPEVFPYVLFFKGDLKPYEQHLGLKDETKPYIFLLDKNGKIVYSTMGRFTEKKMLEIEKILLDN